MKIKIKNEPHILNITRLGHKHTLKYTQYNKKGFSKVMPICIKQRISNIWGTIHYKVKQQCTEVELRKDVAYKKACIHFDLLITCNNILTISVKYFEPTCNTTSAQHCDTDAGSCK